jgi:hypothetical protein
MGAPQKHDQYGKKVLEKAFGDRFNPKPKVFQFDETDKTAGTARIDGEVDGQIAVEIESRASKQVRGALLDLAFHPHKKKLLVLIKKYGNQITPIQAEVILSKLCGGRSVFKVVELEGRGDDPKLVGDVQRVGRAVAALRAL